MASVTCAHVPLATLSHLAFPTGNAREGCKGRGPRAGASDTPHLTLPLPPKGRATLILIVKDGAWHVPALVYSAIEVSCCFYIFFRDAGSVLPFGHVAVRAFHPAEKIRLYFSGSSRRPGRWPRVSWPDSPGGPGEEGGCLRARVCGLRLGRGCSPSPAPSSRSVHAPRDALGLVSDAGNALYCPRVSVEDGSRRNFEHVESPGFIFSDLQC